MLLDVSIDRGVSNWLTALPINDFGFELSKQQLWDPICWRYGWSIANLPTPTTCLFTSRFSIYYCTNYKKEDFVSIRHINLRDLIVKVLSEVCKDIEIEHAMKEFEKLNIVRLNHCFFFSIYGNIGRKCCTFYSILSNTFSQKRDLPKSISKQKYALLCRNPVSSVSEITEQCTELRVMLLLLNLFLEPKDMHNSLVN